MHTNSQVKQIAMSKNIHVVLTIAGSDSGGGAGIQTDLRTISALGGYATSAITCLTSQNPSGVTEIAPTPLSSIRSQIRAVLDFFPVQAIKTGMLYNTEIIEEILTHLNNYRGVITVDPVMISTSGARLISEDAIQCVTQKLLPRATWITPNIPEAETLLNRKITTLNDAKNAAIELGKRYQNFVLLKGGHLTHDYATDFVFINHKLYQLQMPWIEIQPFASHGTGCTLASALTTLSAQHPDSPLENVITAKKFVFGALQNAQKIREGVYQMYPNPHYSQYAIQCTEVTL